MLIRCEKCQALYSLQDGVVRGAHGEVPPAFAVECGRCLAQFEAEAPVSLRSGRKTPPPAISPAPRAGKPKPSAAAELASAAPGGASLARALKPNRPDSAAATGEEDPVARDLARSRKRRKVTLWITVVVALVALASIAVPVLRKRFASVPEAARAKLELAHKKLLLDDFASLEQAAELDQQAAKLAPGEAGPEGERAFALLLAAGAQKDLADRGEARAAQLSDEMAKLQLARPDGFEKQIDGLRSQMLQINEEREPHVHAATQLLTQGRTAALAAHGEDPDDPASLRALALYGALTNSVDSGTSYAQLAEGIAPGDPWNAYVRAQLALCGSLSRDKQDKALAQLASALQASPRLVRALYDEAAIDAERKLTVQAKEKLDKVLAESPAHERAQQLRAALAPPPTPSAPAPAPSPAPQ